MPRKKLAQTWGALAAMVVIVLAGIVISSPRVRANEDNDRDRDHDRERNDSRIEQGFDMAPVPLNLEGKNRKLVGLGSYLVNGVGDCNGCHSAGEFSPGGSPYFGQPKKIDPTTYLGGGQDFGPLVPNSPDIISRNLTPDKTGRPEGGRTFAEFRQIIRTGVDLDHVHPSCSATVTTNCLPPPFDGELLQIMPWATYQGMTDHDLRAIYEYLSAVPCVAGPPRAQLASQRLRRLAKTRPTELQDEREGSTRHDKKGK
jgi:hypothetical protein